MIHTIGIITTPCGPRWVAAMGFLVATSIALTGCQTGNASNAQQSPDKNQTASQTAALQSAVAVKPPPDSPTVPFDTVMANSGAGLKIGYISLDESSSFAHLITESIRREAHTAGADLQFCDSQSSAAKALTCVANFKAAGVQGYINYQADAKAAPSVCAAGPAVPVIAVTIQQNPCQLSLTGANNAVVGQLAGKAVGEYFKQAFNCKYDAYISLENLNGGESNTERMGGYRDGFASVCGPVHDLKQENSINIDTARSVMTDALTALPAQHHIVVVGTNDAVIEGALAAANSTGRQQDIYVSGQGADSSSWCIMKSNSHWIGDAAFFPERWGQIAVPYLIKAIRGQAIPKTLYVPTQIVNSVNIDGVYQPKC